MLPNQPMHAYESLTKAIALEDDHIRRLRRWSLRFRPFDPQVVTIFDLLIREAEGHRGHLLYHTSRHLGWHHRPISRTGPEEVSYADHFFVVSDRSAEAVLESACDLLGEAKTFYRYCARQEVKGSPLACLYQNLGGFKEIQAHVLREACERCRYRLLHNFSPALGTRRLIHNRNPGGAGYPVSAPHTCS